jgi:hypothetical protein
MVAAGERRSRHRDLHRQPTGASLLRRTPARRLERCRRPGPPHAIEATKCEACVHVEGEER